MSDGVARLQAIVGERVARTRRDKRALWTALQTHTPALAAQTAEIHERFGITGGACGGALWGDIDEDDQQWIHNR